MEVRKTIMFRLLAAALVVFLTGCQPIEMLNGASSLPDVGGGNPMEKAHFQAFSAKLNKYCATECHNSVIHKHGVDLSSLEAILAKKGLLIPGDPDKSEIYTTVLEGSMPPKSPLSMELTNELKEWIEQWPVDVPTNPPSRP